MIVLNGEPFTRYCLRQIYPFAHQIVVVEGAVRMAAALATSDGHSRDGTLAAIRAFQREEDPTGKVVLISRDGFWDEKQAMSEAFADRATGDWLWEVAVDEFYHHADMWRVSAILACDCHDVLSFREVQFWGDFETIVDGWYSRRGGSNIHRVFRWGPGYRYACHRPSTVTDAQGRDLRSLRWLNARQTSQMGLRLMHYSLVFPQQVRDKSLYYSLVSWADYSGMQRWAEESYFLLHRPYRVHNVYQQLSWLEHYPGSHPEAIVALRRDIDAGLIGMRPRDGADVQRLLADWKYWTGRGFLKALERMGRSPLRKLVPEAGRRALFHMVASALEQKPRSTG